MGRLALLLILLAAPLWAAPARVLSGEHEGFTRLVVELARPEAWVLGRSADGYELQIDGEVSQFDLTEAFTLIGRSRIAALAADVTGALRVSVGCNCHVIPFEFRPGTIVLDVKDGPPPEGSPYEALLGSPKSAEPIGPEPISPETIGTKLPRPEPMALAPPPIEPVAVSAFAEAWVDAALGGASMPTPEPPNPASPQTALPSALLDPALVPLRDDLLREISKGAAQGIVTMDLPKDAALPVIDGVADPGDQARIGLGALPQIRVTGADLPDLAVEGAQCPTDVQLDLAAWGDDRPIWQQISEARDGLAGEFDQPDAEAIAAAIRFHLFIGFGQEALGLLDAFASTDRDAALWRSIGHVLVDLPDPDPAFAGMESCDSAAALWALLGAPEGALTLINALAAQRAFSALPSGLRHSLGPRVIDRLLALNEVEAVDVVANAVRRLGEGQDRGIAIVAAEVAARAGAFEAADDLLHPLLADPGPQTAEALMARIEGQAARSLPIKPAEVLAMEAYAMERRGGPDAAEFDRVLVLALALGGDFRRAFAEAAAEPDLQADLWRLLADLGPDTAVMEQAALVPGTTAPEPARAVAIRFAARFLQLGLPEQAQIWIAGADSVDGILAAQIALANHDGRAALGHLEGLDGSEAAALRVAALVQSGDDTAAAKALAQAGDATGATAALARARDWAALGASGQPEWQGAAQSLLAPTPGPVAGPLAEALALADQAQGTGTALRALLEVVPPVENSKP